MGKLKLSQYLADLEEKYGLVLYVAGEFKCTFFITQWQMMISF
jgi:hypothetical protein